MKVLVVDDELGVRAVLRRALEREQFEVIEAADGIEAVERAVLEAPDVVVLDLGLPGMSGLDVLSRLRARQSALHIIILTGAATEADRVLGLERGADDYVVKPFSPREVTARVLAVRRRRALPATDRLDFGSLRIDLVAREVRVDDEPVELTRRELDLLCHLATNPRRTFTRAELLEVVWDSSAEWQSPATVTEHVRRLRTKLALNPPNPVRIVTVKGYGYRFEQHDQPEPASHPSVPGWRTGRSEDATVVVSGSTLLHATPAAVELLGVPSADGLRGRDIFDFVAPRSTAAARARYAARLKGQSPRPEALWFQRLAGGEILVEVSTTPIDWQGQPAAQVTLWDLTSDRTTLHELEDEIRAGVQAGEFVVHYQPVVALAGDRWLSVEALVRWDHPRRGLLTPGEFIEVAEASGAIVDLGHSVLEAACGQCGAWRNAGVDLPVSVNLSGRQLADPALFDRIADALAASSLPARYLALEVTETSLVEDIGQAAAALWRAAALGVRVAIDDFGTGWASLTYLHEFPVHALKIDRTFVEAIDTNPADVAIVNSVLSLGQELDLLVIAEGIETASQRDKLRQLGCRAGQGYFFARPSPAEAMVLETGG